MTRPLNRILYVEDEVILQKIMRATLERLGGFTVAVAGSGAEALSMAGDFAPDLILLDVMMPEMDGPTTLQALRARPESASVPVVFITAKAQAGEIARFQNMGVIGVVTKPFDPKQLADSLRSLWAKAEASS